MHLSRKFLPDEIIEIKEVPRTLSGKKLEVPIKKLLLGSNLAKGLTGKLWQIQTA